MAGTSQTVFHQRFCKGSCCGRLFFVCHHYRKTKAGTLQQARKALAAETLRVEKAKTLGYNPPGSETFAEVSTRYLKHQRPRLIAKAFDRSRGVVEGSLVDWFTVKIAAIKKSDVQGYVAKRMDEVSPGSVIRELGILKHLFTFAVEQESPASPAASIKSPKAPVGRVRYLQRTELKALLELCPAWLQPIVALAVTTGMRRGEILGLRWVDVDLANSTVWLPQTKNGEGRRVYLNATAKAALESMSLPAAASHALVFDGINGDYVGQTFRKACTDLGIADFRFHDLRHTAASWLRKTGADIHSVGALLGHKNLRMTARYSHLSPAF